MSEKLRQVTDPKEIAGYVTCLRSVSSERNHRSGEIGPCHAEWVGLNLVVTVRNSRLGEYKVTFTSPRVLDYRSNMSHTPVPTPEVVAQVVPAGTWWVDFDAKWVRTEATTISAEVLTLGFDELLVDAVDKSELPDDGHCKACGSDEFTLQTFAQTLVKATGLNEYQALGESKLLLKNASIHIRCAKCGTQSESLRGRYELQVTGVRS